MTTTTTTKNRSRRRQVRRLPFDLGDSLVSSLTDDELEWISTSDHPLAARIRFWGLVVLSWPTRLAPWTILAPMIAAMRWGRSGRAVLTEDALVELRKAAGCHEPWRCDGKRLRGIEIEEALLWYGITSGSSSRRPCSARVSQA